MQTAEFCLHLILFLCCCGWRCF